MYRELDRHAYESGAEMARQLNRVHPLPRSTALDIAEAIDQGLDAQHSLLSRLALENVIWDLAMRFRLTPSEVRNRAGRALSVAVIAWSEGYWAALDTDAVLRKAE